MRGAPPPSKMRRKFSPVHDDEGVVATQDFSQLSPTLRHCHFARRARSTETPRHAGLKRTENREKCPLFALIKNQDKRVVKCGVNFQTGETPVPPVKE